MTPEQKKTDGGRGAEAGHISVEPPRPLGLFGEDGSMTDHLGERPESMTPDRLVEYVEDLRLI